MGEEKGSAVSKRVSTDSGDQQYVNLVLSFHAHASDRLKKHIFMKRFFRPFRCELIVRQLRPDSFYCTPSCNFHHGVS